MRVTSLAGGAGAAKFLQGLIRVTDPAEVTIIGNTGDDAVIHELHVSPDLDIVTYTLAGLVDEARGWGIKGDTTHALDQLAGYGIESWFTLGDRDIGTHLARTSLLAEGRTLSQIADQIRRSLRVGARILPMTDQPVRTRIITADGTERQFQEYFVRFHHQEQVIQVHFDGAADAWPAPGVIEAIESAEKIIVCPSNPVLSIGPILAVPGIRDALVKRREDVCAISPIVGGKAIKGPAAGNMSVASVEASAYGVAVIYRDFCGTLILDECDAAECEDIMQLDVRPVVAQTVMRDPADAARLAREVLAL
jgi:LPPG:FO 2-phospho-L-lactate transferase